MITVADIPARLAAIESDRVRLTDEIANLERRDQTPGRDQRIDDLGTAIGRLDTEQTQLQAAQRTAEGNSGSIEHGHDRPPESVTGRRDDRRPGPNGQAIGEALRAIDADPHATDGAKHLASALVERDLTGAAARWAQTVSGDDYLRAFAKLIADPANGHRTFTAAELEAFQQADDLKRAMTIGTDTAGGFLVPFTLDPAIMLTDAGAIDPIREIARTVQIVTDSWNGVTSAGVSTRWAAEESEASDDSPALAQPSIAVHKADSFVPYSIEVGQDAVDLVGQLRELFTDAKMQHEATAWIDGSGSGQPTGVVTALDGGSSEVSPATAETFAAADIYSTLEALPPRFRARAQWGAALSTINDSAQFETTNGAKLFPDLDAAAPTLLRRRLHETSNMRGTADINVAATEDNHILIVADWRNYVIVDRVGMTVEPIPHLFGTNHRPTGQRGAYMYWRVGADVVIDNAFRVLNVATTA